MSRDDSADTSLFAHLQELVRADPEPVDAIVPFDDYPIYYLIASEMARIAVAEAPGDFVLLVDSLTAAQVDAADAARNAARAAAEKSSPQPSA